MAEKKQSKLKEILKKSPLNIKGAIEGYKRLGKKVFTKGSGTKRQAKDVPTMAAKGGRVGLLQGGKPKLATRGWK